MREEIITSQIQNEIKKVSLPLAWAKWMIEENKKDQSSEIQSSEIFSQSTKDEISLLDSKIEKLMNAYLENALSLEEYRDAKSALVGSKQLLKEKLSAFEKKSHNRFELTEKFLKDNITNAELANEKTNEENLHLFKKVGSNFLIKDRTVLFEPRGAWKILLDSGFGGGNALVSALRADPILHSETLFENLRRERDSNPRWVLPHATLAVWCLEPLGHLSIFTDDLQLLTIDPMPFRYIPALRGERTRSQGRAGSHSATSPYLNV